MSLTQRDYDIRQLESELKMQKLFDQWRQAFLAGRIPGQVQDEEPPVLDEAAIMEEMRGAVR